jgi:DNA-directed RNA polymerase subunit F
MAIKINKPVESVEPVDVDQVKQSLINAHELDKEAIQGIFKLKPVALTKLQAMLDSKDSRTVLQASRLILEFGNS